MVPLNIIHSISRFMNDQDGERFVKADGLFIFRQRRDNPSRSWKMEMKQLKRRICEWALWHPWRDGGRVGTLRRIAPQKAPAKYSFTLKEDRFCLLTHRHG